MREEINDKGRLEHILAAIDVLLKGKEIHDLEHLKSDPILFYGFVKNVEIIGEAVYMLSKPFKTNHESVKWSNIEAMRHVLVHGYYKISPDRLWDTIEHDIPSLRPIIAQYLSEFQPTASQCSSQIHKDS